MTDDLPEVRAGHPYVMYDMLKATPKGIRRTLEVMRNLDYNFLRGNLYVTGNGTAFHAGVIGAQILSEHGTHWYPIQAFELEKYQRPDGTVVAFSHTGKTKSTVDAVKTARTSSFTFGITHYANSPLTKVSNESIVIGDSPDQSLCNTKAFFDNAFAALEISSHYGKIEVDTENLVSLVEENLRSKEEEARDIAAELKGVRSIFVLGAGPNYFVAREAAQKMKEATHLYAEGIELEEFNHGCTSVIDERTLVVIINSPEIKDRAGEIARACRHIGARTLTLNGPGDYSVEVDQTGNIFLDAIPKMVPLYYLAYFLSLELGINPDYLRFEDSRYLGFDSTVFPPGTH